MAAKDRSRGKAWERSAATLFGLRRRRSGEGLEFDDCVQQNGSPAVVSLECKAYEKVQLRQSWIEQARRNAAGRPWIVAQRPKGWRRPIATVDLEWLAWLVATHVGPLSPPTKGGISGEGEGNSTE